MLYVNMKFMLSNKFFLIEEKKANNVERMKERVIKGAPKIKRILYTKKISNLKLRYEMLYKVT